MALGEDGYTIHGWACGGRSPARLYHCYVVPELRRVGLAGVLVAKVAGQIPVETAKPWPYGHKNYQYNPYCYAERFKDGC